MPQAVQDFSMNPNQSSSPQQQPQGATSQSPQMGQLPPGTIQIKKVYQAKANGPNPFADMGSKPLGSDYEEIKEEII